MSIDTGGMTPEQRQELLEQLQREESAANADAESAEMIDQKLEGRLIQKGVRPGDQWERPERAYQAYPAKWLVWHRGHFWMTVEHGVMSEPGPDSDEWKLNDPEPAVESPEDAPDGYPEELEEEAS